MHGCSHYVIVLELVSSMEPVSIMVSGISSVGRPDVQGYGPKT